MCVNDDEDEVISSAASKDGTINVGLPVAWHTPLGYTLILALHNIRLAFNNILRVTSYNTHSVNH